MAFNPFSLLFEDRNDPATTLLNDIPLPEVSTTPIECTEVNATKTQSLSKDTGSPVCVPLSTLESVLSWRPGLDDMSVASVSLSPRDPHSFDGPSVVVCHDMMGGYTKDRFIQGHTSLDDYYFYHWQQISAFIYFSHHFVTIPPTSWTNAAHRHGVLSLGTVITEWQDGVKLCSVLLRDEATAVMFAEQLISIAEYYGFDGWLINIENPIHQSQMDNLYVLLTLLVTGIHQRVPGSKVIWYDSVTTDGELKWQNKVNEKNEYFFSLCDGIFLNYHWKRQFLADTQLIAGEARCKDVFVGIDVFGRGTFGGGGFNCSIAMDVIKDYNLSMAIFAPGWVYENLDKENFFDNQDRFWQLLSSFQSPFPSASSLPFVSSFSRGCGHQVAIDGKVYYSGPWTNLSTQDLQLTFPECLFKNDPQSCVEFDSVGVVSSPDIVPYNNGSVVMIQGTVTDSNGPINKPAIVRLFKCNIPIEKVVIVSYTYDSSDASDIAHCLRLRTSESEKFVLLRPTEYKADTVLMQNVKVIDALPEKDEQIIHSLFTGNDGTSSSPWKTKYFLFRAPSSIVKGISICVFGQGQSNSQKNKKFNLKIGEIKICHSNVFKNELLNVHNIRVTNTTLRSVTLAWDHHHNNSVDPLECFNVFIRRGEGFDFVGRSFNKMFHMPVANLSNTLSVYIQPVTVSRRKLPVNLNSSLKIIF